MTLTSDIPSLGFTPSEVLQHGIDSRGRTEWHANPKSDGVWRWHASSLGRCPRRLILERAGYATDPRPLEGELTMHLGTVFHSVIEQWIKDFIASRDGVEIITQETGFWHTSLPLAAKPDVLLSVRGVPYLVDFKTEHENAAKRRSDDAKEHGRYTNAKVDHMIQLAATAMCIEGHDDVVNIPHGAVWYVSKNNLWIESAPVDLNDSYLRAEITRRVEKLERAWSAWTADGSLPAEIPDGSDGLWECRAVKGAEWGRYCSARSACKVRFGRG